MDSSLPPIRLWQLHCISVDDDEDDDIPTEKKLEILADDNAAWDEMFKDFDKE